MLNVAQTRRLRNIVLIALVVAVGGGVGIYEWVTTVNRNTARIVRKEANQLILALERHDASLVPGRGEDWVPGVWALFRRVDSGSVVNVRMRQHTGSNARSSGSDWVADILLHTGRGLVLLELAFRSPSFSDGDQQVDILYELSPDRIPHGLVDAATLARLAADQRERGPKLADDLVITIAGQNATDSAQPVPTAPAPSPPPAPKLAVPRPKLPPVIRCIRRVRPDVQKIQACVRRYGP